MESPTKRRRINVHISERAYRALVRLAGGEKHMGAWLEGVIERESKTHAEITNEELLQRIKAFQASLNKILKDLDG